MSCGRMGESPATAEYFRTAMWLLPIFNEVRLGEAETGELRSCAEAPAKFDCSHVCRMDFLNIFRDLQ